MRNFESNHTTEGPFTPELDIECTTPVLLSDIQQFLKDYGRQYSGETVDGAGETARPSRFEYDNFTGEDESLAIVGQPFEEDGTLSYAPNYAEVVGHAAGMELARALDPSGVLKQPYVNTKSVSSN